jgi:hypothetical protein
VVTVKLLDGLGNQMFQYALGRTIAHRHGTSLALDIRGYPDYNLRRYSLGAFKIEGKLTSGGLMRFGLVRAVRLRVRVPGLPYLVIERSSAFDPSVLQAPRNVYLGGYWQSEKYFSEIDDVIRRDFCFKSGPDGQNREVAASIQGVHSVSVHVRRGDYSTSQLLGTCPPVYYRDAAQVIASRITSPHYFVFSDEPDWARANLELKGPATFVTHNGPDRDFEDMRLMALCRHHIIANSTFSWWGAWLSGLGGIVVAPKQWFKIEEPRWDARDIVPERWIRV